MTQKVIFQRLLFEEASATLLTRKRLLVDLHVLLQITFKMKTDVAMLTGELLRCPGLFVSKPSSLHPPRLDFFIFSAVVSGNWKREGTFKKLVYCYMKT